MTKAKSKSPVAPRSKGGRKNTNKNATAQRARGKHLLAKKVLPASHQPRSGTKQDIVLRMLRASSGATIADMMRATGWQQHSVRGFLAGVVRKKLKLDLISEPAEAGRIYRLMSDAVSVTQAKKARSAKAAA